MPVPPPSWRRTSSRTGRVPGRGTRRRALKNSGEPGGAQGAYSASAPPAPRALRRDVEPAHAGTPDPLPHVAARSCPRTAMAPDSLDVARAYPRLRILLEQLGTRQPRPPLELVTVCRGGGAQPALSLPYGTSPVARPRGPSAAGHPPPAGLVCRRRSGSWAGRISVSQLILRKTFILSPPAPSRTGWAAPRRAPGSPSGGRPPRRLVAVQIRLVTPALPGPGRAPWRGSPPDRGRHGRRTARWLGPGRRRPPADGVRESEAGLCVRRAEVRLARR